jgi:hypothetical protein
VLYKQSIDATKRWSATQIVKTIKHHISAEELYRMNMSGNGAAKAEERPSKYPSPYDHYG